MHIHTSLRGKITFGYYAIGTLILGLSLLAFMELHLIEKRILAGERVSEFFDATLELRRFEKNYFLYQQEADYGENLSYVARTRELLYQHSGDFTTLASPEAIAKLQDNLDTYPRLMAEYATVRQDTVEAHRLEQRIRSLGKEIVTVGEEMSSAERTMLQSSLDRHRNKLIISIGVLTLLIVLIGQVLSRMVAKPLKDMEESMEAVARGKLDKLRLATSDREIESLTNAINHVLRELELRQKHLVRSEKLVSLGTLLSGVAHELNNPLSNISTSCQILLEEDEEADAGFRKELLTQIDEQTLRARNIVRSLLDFARDRAFKREPLLLAPLMDETLRFIKGQVPAGVSIVSEIPGGIGIHGDKQRLQQVFLNLLKNALESVEGQGQIWLRARRTTTVEAPAETSRRFSLGRCEGAPAVEIEVRDSGHGIPPEVLPRIFDPFFTTKDVGKGSGLGLFIVYEIIEEHGGCIAVESEPQHGTAFFIRLPLKESEHHG